MYLTPTLLVTLAFASPAADPPPVPSLPEAIGNWTLAALDLPAAPPEAFTLTVDLGGEMTTVHFHRHTIRSGNFEVLVDDGTGVLTAIDPSPAVTFRGVVDGDPDAVVAASLLEDGLSAMIRLSSDTTWMIEPVARLSPTPIPGDTRHAIYAGEDIIPTDHYCGTDTIDAKIPVFGAEGGVAGNTPNWAEIGIETDYEFFLKNGASVTNTINDIELVMNNVDAIYDRDVNIGYEISTIVIRSSSSDPYSATAIVDRLCEFRNTWNSAPESSIQRDFAHMFSGFGYSGGTIGVAWLGVLCNVSGSNCGSNGSLAYGIVESKYLSNTPLYLRTSLSCHEMGHNWDATHCDSQGNSNCHIMCSSNGACGGVSGANLKLDPLSINEITAYKNSVSCEPVISAPLSLPFIDEFSSLSLSSTRWIYNKGCSVSSLGVNEPSAPYSLNLDSLGSNAYQDDEVRSNKMLLSGLGAVKFSYYTERRNVETGKKFFVDYFNSAGKWINLNTITSDGVTQDTYDFWQVALPANAKHNGFRIRFYPDGDDGTDDWYVDNIRVELGSLCPADLVVNGIVDGADLAVVLGAWGTSSSLADIDGSGTVDGADLAIVLGAWGPCP